ncbi:MAG: UDP-N-acetylmuramate dehydrogenase [Defluviitaleaceae bacterium]|nr:UDP-N-acetylmuramate dehydrogenase [Defluviitaleaceae bacterium]MCL2263342.1 UDP-N-acetylmuramate dehydrogenase [Defluviitaleaceae bacterium]
MTIINSLCETVLTNEPMRKYTSFRIGGPADFMAFPKTADELINVWKACKENDIPITVLGDGANVLVFDDGIRGVVVFTHKMNAIEPLENDRVKAQSGARLSALAEVACNASLSGLAFASGIPGTIGGAVFMNAGAYDYEMKDVIESVTLFLNGETVTKTNEEMQFGYRKSFVQSGEMLVLEAVFKLEKGDSTQIREQMKELNARRKKSQPLDVHSAGSFFKRPPGFFAGKLIQDSGLKGYAVGDAQVSDKHAGFVVNKGNATAKDILTLMHHVQKTVFENYGVNLEPEVQILG